MIKKDTRLTTKMVSETVSNIGRSISKRNENFFKLYQLKLT